MKRIITVIIIAVTIGWTLSVNAFADSEGSPCADAEQTILRLLANPVHEAIEDYYGEPRQYWNDEVVAIKKASGTPYYEVIVRVETFYGPHNPPYGIETISFYISYGTIKLKSFQHQNEPD